MLMKKNKGKIAGNHDFTLFCIFELATKKEKEGK